MQNTNHPKTNVSSLNELQEGKSNLSITSMQMQSNFLVIGPESMSLQKVFQEDATFVQFASKHK